MRLFFYCLAVLFLPLNASGFDDTKPIQSVTEKDWGYTFGFDRAEDLIHELELVVKYRYANAQRIERESRTAKEAKDSRRKGP